jgi:hypothetical protein
LRFAVATWHRGPPQKLQTLDWVGKAKGEPFYQPLGHISQVHGEYFY